MEALNQYLAESSADSFHDATFAEFMDSLSVSLPHLRSEFEYPTKTTLAQTKLMPAGSQGSGPAIYFCGNSLGLMPKATRKLVKEELDIWAGTGVLGHFDHALGRPWKDITETVQESMAHVVGAETSEVAVMGTLTANLHTMLSAFYRPAGKRTKIMFEAKAFPSDEYAFTSQVRLHGLRPKEHLIAVAPRDGEYVLRTEDIMTQIEAHKDELAVVMFSGIQYYTGQFFEIEKITEKGHEAGAVVGWDLAHAVGNVPLQLHAWKVDFACWCNYKYVNSGPGAIAGIFVHSDARTPSTADDEYHYENRLAGWWGHNTETRFLMEPTFDPIPGAAGYQLSNPSVLNTVSLLASLNVFKNTSMHALRAKSVLLTAYLEHLLIVEPPKNLHGASYRIITPTSPDARGAQLSVLFQPLNQGIMEFVMEYLLEHCIIADERRPDVIRLSPIPMYNTFVEVHHVANAVRAAIQAWTPRNSGEDRLEQTT